MAEQNYDVIIVGGGPGGYVAAIRSAQLNLKTALVERDLLGGTCLNWGCIPTKSLLFSAEMYRKLKNSAVYGLRASEIGIDIREVVKRSRSVSNRLQKGVGFLLKKSKVTVVDGTAKLDGSGKVVVEKGGVKSVITGQHIILATGAGPIQFKGMEADGKLVWTSKEAMIPDSLPEKLLIIGAGAIGIEFAGFYNEMGVDVTLVEAMPQVLPGADEELSAALKLQLLKQGITVRTSTFLRGLEKESDSVTALLECNGNEERIAADRVLLAMGVTGNVENLGLEGTKVQIDRGFIRVNEWMQTADPGIYAIGDVAGPPCLAHKAGHEGVICVERIAGVAGVKPLERGKIAYCVYSYPQVASIGMTEQQARKSGYEIKKGIFPLAGNGKAVVLGEGTGIIKTIFDARTGELLGAHMMGAEVTELIQGYAIAMIPGITGEALMKTILPHPTLSEAMHEAVLAAYGRAIHS